MYLEGSKPGSGDEPGYGDEGTLVPPALLFFRSESGVTSGRGRVSAGDCEPLGVRMPGRLNAAAEIVRAPRGPDTADAGDPVRSG